MSYHLSVDPGTPPPELGEPQVDPPPEGTGWSDPDDD